MPTLDNSHDFEAHRRFLFGIAYRLLGTRAEAEDAVQDTYLKWRDADVAALNSPRAWLTSVCTRYCIDLMRSAQRTRMEYVGTWLPEPLESLDETTPETTTELASSLSTAFLLVLDRLAPKERAAYLLHDIFERDYSEIGATLNITKAACRKLVSRAREGVGRSRAGHAPPRARQSQLLDAFREAISLGSVDALAQLLAEDVTLSADGGGKVPTLRETLAGQSAVLSYIANTLRGYWRDYTWQQRDINGTQGVVLADAGKVIAVMSLAWDAEGKANAIYIVRNPDKLTAVVP